MASIQHIAIMAKETDGLAEFYKQTFGMREVQRYEAKNPGDAVPIFLADGHINLAILPARPGRPEGIRHFGFVVDDIEATRTIGVSMGGEPGENDLPRDGRYAEGYIVDPAGNRVDLTDKGWDTGEGRPQ